MAVQHSKIGRKRKTYSALNPKRKKIYGVKADCEAASEKKKMNKTKRRLSAILVITGVLVLGVLALSTGIVSEDSSPLNDWNGTWVNVGTMLDDPAMNVVYEAMTDAANAAAGGGTFTTDDASSFLQAMHKSNFGDLGLAENNITYYTDGTVKCDCEYESVGVETVAFREEEFNWYKFALTSEDAACSEYKYLILLRYILTKLAWFTGT